jgi:hypothetical protein
MATDPAETAAAAETPPLVTELPSPHVQVCTPYHLNYYDPTSDATFGKWAKLPEGGPVSLETGDKAGTFPDSGPWHQV